MLFFAKQKQKDTWFALVGSPEGVCATLVRRSSGRKPEVLTCVTQRASLADPAGLEKLTRDLELERYPCTTLLQPGEYQLLPVEAPKVPADELITAVRWRIKDLLDYPVDNATVDMLDIPSEKYAPHRPHMVYAVAASNDVIRRRSAVFEQAGIPLSAIDIPDLAQRNVAALLEQNGTGVAMLSFNGTGGMLTVTFGGELYLARHIDVTAARLLEADPEQRQQLFGRIELEVLRSLDYCERQLPFIPLKRLVIAPLAKPIGLPEYLSEHVERPVEALNLGDLFDFSRVPELRHAVLQARCFLALGAALRLEEKLP